MLTSGVTVSIIILCRRCCLLRLFLAITIWLLYHRFLLLFPVTVSTVSPFPACVRADEFLIPAQVLVSFSIGFSISLNAYHALAGYWHKWSLIFRSHNDLWSLFSCTFSLTFSFFINVLLIFAYFLLEFVVEKEVGQEGILTVTDYRSQASSITESIKKWRLLYVEKSVYSSIPWIRVIPAQLYYKKKHKQLRSNTKIIT